jgi:hypothetical protein
LVTYFSPLAPAVVLFVSAVALLLVMPRLPAGKLVWLRNTPAIVRPEDLSTVGLVGLVLALLGLRLTLGQMTAGEGLELLSGWDFSTAASVAALTVRADSFSLPFLILVVLLLLAVTLAVDPETPPTAPEWASWLALGGGACFVFVAANGLTLSYAILAFDLCATLYWLHREQRDLGVARLFLSLLTAAGLALASATPTNDFVPPTLLLEIALWLRLGLYPFIETTALEEAPADDYGWLVYVVLSLATGLHLGLRVATGPWLAVTYGLTLLLMVLGGLLAWLSEAHTRTTGLTRLVVVETLLLFLGLPLGKEAAIAGAVGLLLSLVALWLTPRLGPPPLADKRWPWPYLPAAMATITLVGLPFSSGWLARSLAYQALLVTDSRVAALLAMLAEELALGSLLFYWLNLWRGAEQNIRQGVAGIIVMVPFLIPGLALFVLATITRLDLPLVDFALPVGVLIMTSVTIIGAALLGYYRTPIMAWLRISATPLLRLSWLFAWGQGGLDQAGRLALRLGVILEGQHYLGWALLVAMVGILVILLRT